MLSVHLLVQLIHINKYRLYFNLIANNVVSCIYYGYIWNSITYWVAFPHEQFASLINPPSSLIPVCIRTCTSSQRTSQILFLHFKLQVIRIYSNAHERSETFSQDTSIRELIYDVWGTENKSTKFLLFRPHPSDDEINWCH